MIKKKKQIETVVSFILDESGSMSVIKDSVIEGFNEYLKGLKSKKGAKVLFSLTKFDSSHVLTPYVMSPIQQVEPLDDNTYQPGASTPLYDAVVETIEKLEPKINKEQAVIVAIMTDGYENASRNHNEKCLRELIERLQGRGNWTFVFMGANQDSWALAQTIGITRGNTMDWQASPMGTQSVFSAMADSTTAYARSMNTNASVGKNINTANFFAGSTQTQEDTKEVNK